jgi:hypothetical protein
MNDKCLTFFMCCEQVRYENWPARAMVAEIKEEASFWRPHQPGGYDLSPKAGPFLPSPEEEMLSV